MVALAYFGRLQTHPGIPKFDIDDGIYQATYYYPEEQEILSGWIEIKNYSQTFNPIFNSDTYMNTQLGMLCTPLMAILELDERVSISKQELNAYQKKIIEVVVINNDVVSVYVTEHNSIFGPLTIIDTEKALQMLGSKKLDNGEYYYGYQKDMILRVNNKYYNFGSMKSIWIVDIL
jgi:hypothetical protein